MKYLFVCYGNADRSPTAAGVCREMAREKGLQIEVDSAGFHPGGGTKITRELADSADKIFVMETYMADWLRGDYRQSPDKITCLDVEDDYDTAYPQEKAELKRIFREKLDALERIWCASA